VIGPGGEPLLKPGDKGVFAGAHAASLPRRAGSAKRGAHAVAQASRGSGILPEIHGLEANAVRQFCRLSLTQS
jgi:hypothetical protein